MRSGRSTADGIDWNVPECHGMSRNATECRAHARRKEATKVKRKEAKINRITTRSSEKTTQNSLSHAPEGQIEREERERREREEREREKREKRERRERMRARERRERMRARERRERVPERGWCSSPSRRAPPRRPPSIRPHWWRKTPTPPSRRHSAPAITHYQQLGTVTCGRVAWCY